MAISEAESLAEFALREAEKKSEWAEVVVENWTNTTLTIKNEMVEPPEFSGGLGLSIRLLAGKKIGFGSTNILTRTNLRDLVVKTVKKTKSKKFIPKDVELAPVEVGNEKWEAGEKKSFDQVKPEEISSLLLDINKSMKNCISEVKLPTNLIVANYEKRDKLFISTNGSRIYGKIPRTSILFFCGVYTPERGSAERYFQLGASKGLEVFEEWDLIERCKKETEMLARILMKRKGIRASKLPLVVGPEVAGIIAHESIGHPAEADRILGREAAQAGKSYMHRSMLGERIGSDETTVIDDPALDGSFGYYLWDDEGVKARKKELIKDGHVKEFLLNRECARELGTESNGSARSSSYALEPLIRMSNTYFAPGDMSFDELIEDISHGIYIRNFMEWNIDDERVNQKYVGLEARKIEQGELKDFVRMPTIETTSFNLHPKLEAKGKDLSFSAASCGKGDPMQSMPVWMGGPDLKFSDMWIRSR
jgi:TldD protein